MIEVGTFRLIGLYKSDHSVSDIAEFAAEDLRDLDAKVGKWVRIMEAQAEMPLDFELWRGAQVGEWLHEGNRAAGEGDHILIAGEVLAFPEPLAESKKKNVTILMEAHDQLFIRTILEKELTAAKGWNTRVKADVGGWYVENLERILAELASIEGTN